MSEESKTKDNSASQATTPIGIYIASSVPLIATLTLAIRTLIDDYLRGRIWHDFKTLSPEFVNVWDFWQQYSWFLIAICGLAFFGGAIALRRMVSKHLRPIELVIIGFIVFIIFGMLNPTCKWSAKTSYRTYMSKVNMWRISCALEDYREAHGQKSRHLSDLYASYIPDANTFFPPSRSANRNKIDAEGYLYFPAADDKDILLAERANTRPWKGGGEFVLFANGHFEWVSSEETLLEMLSEAENNAQPTPQKKTKQAKVILEVELIEDHGGSKYHWQTVRPLRIIKNESKQQFKEPFQVAHLGWEPGIPSGTSIIYLDLYNPERDDLWRLVETNE